MAAIVCGCCLVAPAAPSEAEISLGRKMVVILTEEAIFSNTKVLIARSAIQLVN